MAKLGFVAIGILAYIIDIALYALVHPDYIDYYLAVNLAGKSIAFLLAFFAIKFIFKSIDMAAFKGRVLNAVLVMNIFLATCLLYVTVDLMKMPALHAKLGADAIVIVMSIVTGRYLLKAAGAKQTELPYEA
jgi:putative flippase GtrA